MTNGKRLVKQQATTGGHLPVLGFMVWWGMNNVRVPESEAQRQWDAAALPKETMPKAPSAKAAYTQAVTRATVGIELPDDATVRVERVTEDASKIVHRIVRVVTTSAGGKPDIDHHLAKRVALLKATETVRVEDPNDPVAVNIARHYVHHHKHVCSDDASPAVTRTIRNIGGVPLRHNGGVYYVPVDQREMLEALAGVVEGWGGSEMYPVPLHDTSQARRSVTTAAKSSFTAELAAVRDELRTWTDNMGNDDAPTVRTSTLTRRLEQLQAMEARASFYVDTLDMARADVLAGVDDVKIGIERLIADLL